MRYINSINSIYWVFVLPSMLVIHHFTATHRTRRGDTYMSSTWTTQTQHEVVDPPWDLGFNRIELPHRQCKELATRVTLTRTLHISTQGLTQRMKARQRSSRTSTQALKRIISLLLPTMLFGESGPVMHTLRCALCVLCFEAREKREKGPTKWVKKSSFINYPILSLKYW